MATPQPALAPPAVRIEWQYQEYKGLVARTVEVLGSDLEATKWLSSPSNDFEKRTPLQEFERNGLPPVLHVLGKIEHGIFS
ncbi:MAG: antitoxin Xre/MbcA/ParS toxin-binding domain-containing protein [Bryobacteraceae bacterium]